MSAFVQEKYMFVKFSRTLFLLGFIFLSLMTVAEAQKVSGTKTKPIQKPVEAVKITPQAKTPALNLALSALEMAIVEEINLARVNPQTYIAHLEEYRKYMNDKTLSLPNKTKLLTIEGTAAVDDAISDLKNRSKIAPFELSNGLIKVARQQMADLQENVALKHFGKDGSDLELRLMKVGYAGNAVSENITYRAETAREVVLNMIIDDGVKSRSHRKNVFNSNFKLFGIACGTASNQKIACVAEFADSFKER